MKTKTYSISKIINANSEMLFKIVSDFESYSKWNTIIPNATGKLREGAELQLEMKMNGKSKLFNPIVLSIETGKRFLLSKIFLSKKIGELTHQFEFEKLGNNQTKFIQTWEGRGILVGIMWSKIRKGFSDFEIFNNDLTKYLEKRNTNNE